jgi:hypothetical protein
MAISGYQPVVLESHREDRRRKEPSAQSDPPAPMPAGGAGIETVLNAYFR